MSKEFDPFYLVWNPAGRSPYFQHMAVDQAVTEAKRLAATNPGHEFYVVKAIGLAQKVEVNYTPAKGARESGDDPEIPF